MRPTIAVTQAHIQIPELRDVVASGRLKPDGAILGCGVPQEDERASRRRHTAAMLDHPADARLALLVREHGIVPLLAQLVQLRGRNATAKHP